MVASDEREWPPLGVRRRWTEGIKEKIRRFEKI